MKQDLSELALNHALLEAAFVEYDRCSRVSTLAKARAASAWNGALIAADDASRAHKAEIKAAEEVYRIAQELRK
jgi:hypothetical protein